MRTIAYYSNTLVLGGSEVYLKELLKNINKKKYKILFISPHRHPLREWIKTERQIQCLDLDNVIDIYGHEDKKDQPHSSKVETKKSSDDPAFKKIWRQCTPNSIKLLAGTFKEINRLKEFFKKYSIDLIHFNDTGCEPPVIAAYLAGIPNITGTFHVEPSYDKEKNNWARRLIEFFSVRSMHLGIAVSQAVRDAWIHRTAVSKNKILVIYNGIDLEKYNSIKINKSAYLKELNCLETDSIVCVPARLHPMKGHPYLLSAIKEHFLNRPNIKFVFVGEGHARRAIEETIKDNGLSQNVRLLGFRKDMTQIMMISDLIVLPSIALEALPFVLIEAMACRKPVVATDFSGIPEIVEHNVTGLLVARKDPTALANAIDKIIQSPDRANSMGEKGRSRMEHLFTQERMLEETFMLYESIFDGKKE